MKTHENKTSMELPNVEGNHCFGCGPENNSGLKMKFFAEEDAVVSWLHVKKDFCGWSNLMHGGIISSILDEIMSWSAIYLLKKFILTKSIQVDFLKPLYVTDDLKAEGRVGERKSEREAVMNGFLYNKKGELCARSTGSFALIDSEAVRKFGIMDEDMFKSFEALIKHFSS
ncbi:MAG: PaaI family thioesterase [Spirochaetes bacterium]|jgi:uncharacterized protein (TIGR00369 family)|nr:PaaI family thioesterase [Spirochaetota bacterium]